MKKIDGDLWACSVPGCIAFNPQKSSHRLKSHLFEFHSDILASNGILLPSVNDRPIKERRISVFL